MAAHERDTELLSGALSTARNLVALQAGSRLVTFGLNQCLLRLATPHAYGTVAIQLELLLNTILFFSREGIRGAVIRSGNAKGQKHKDIVRTTFLPFLAGMPISIAGCALYIWTADDTVAHQPHFYGAVVTYSLAALLELASEPMFLLGQMNLDSKHRVTAEGSAVIARALITVLALYSSDEQYALAAFAAGQLTYAVVLLIVLSISYGDNAIAAAQGSAQLDSDTANLALALTKQALVKQVSQEGDKLAVTRLCAIHDQGAYAVALNYGSLVVRILFQPIEEAGRLYFSTAFGTSKKLKAAELARARSALGALVHFQVLLGMAALAFAPPYVPLLCHLLLGSRWRDSSAAALLRSYVYLLPILGLNGVLEAFVHSTALQDELGRSSRALGVASVLFAGSCYLFSSLYGPLAAMLGTAVGMSYRIWWSAHFANKKLGGLEAWWRPPSFRVLAAFSSAAFFTRGLEPPATAMASTRDHMLHVGIGGLAFLTVVAMSWRTEKDLFVDVKHTLHKKSK